MDDDKVKTESNLEVSVKKNIRKRHLGSLLIIAGILIIAIPIVGKFITNKKQQDMLESFYLELENRDMTQADANNNLDEVLAWGADSGNQEEIVVNAENIEQGQPKSTTIKKMPKTIGTIFIDKINIKLPIADGVNLETLKFAVGHMTESASLGDVGNAVLAGHRSHTFGTFFNRLDELDVGDFIVIQKGDGTKVNYEVYEKLFVKPNDTSVLNGSSEHRVLTLITCHPEINPDSRLIIHAVSKGE
ncbi:MAG: class C sortase [Firmicutes bacterium HGW-Firmicutes-1]|jgi:sortase A|nr:MAG: class C sortase [Firmicutes bacterium HGW-Firmicutes-1]